MNKAPSWFCRCLDRAAGHGDVAAAWQAAMVDDWPWARQLLRATDRLAPCYPKLEAGPSSTAAYRVVWREEEADRYIASCPDGTGLIELRRSDLLVHELDLHALARRIATAMDLVFDYEAVPGLPHAVRIGAAGVMTAGETWVYLVLAATSGTLTDTLAGLTVRHLTPSIVLTPTKTYWSVWPETIAARCRVMAMDATFTVTPDGRWLRSDPPGFSSSGPGVPSAATIPSAALTATVYLPSVNELEVLRVLGGAKTRLVQEDIAAATDVKGKSLSRKTIGRALKTLAKHGLIDWVAGTHAAAKLTAAGHAAVRRGLGSQ